MIYLVGLILSGVLLAGLIASEVRERQNHERKIREQKQSGPLSKNTALRFPDGTFFWCDRCKSTLFTKWGGGVFECNTCREVYVMKGAGDERTLS